MSADVEGNLKVGKLSTYNQDGTLTATINSGNTGGYAQYYPTGQKSFEIIDGGLTFYGESGKVTWTLNGQTGLVNYGQITYGFNQVVLYWFGTVLPQSQPDQLTTRIFGYQYYGTDQYNGTYYTDMDNLTTLAEKPKMPYGWYTTQQNGMQVLTPQTGEILMCILSKDKYFILV